MDRDRLIRRCRALRNWESFNVLLFMGLLVRWVVTAQPQTWYLTAYSVVLVCYILVQGSIYWHLKLRSLQQRHRLLPSYFSSIFTKFHHSTLALLLLFPVIASNSWRIRQTTIAELVWSSTIAGFALLEYVNYYHYQLKHDTVNDLRYLLQHKRFRRAPLAVDLALARQDRTRHF